MRIISLLPSATEIVGALGMADHLVAVSHECDIPASAADLPKATRSILGDDLNPSEIDRAVTEAARAGRPLYEVDPALIEGLGPDVIVTQGVCSVCAVTSDTVRTAFAQLPDALVRSIQVLELGGKSHAGVLDDIRAVGVAIGAESQASSLTAELRRRWSAVAAQPEPDDRPRVLMLEWPDPPWTGGHWVPEQVAVAGGVDLFGRPGEDSQRVGWDEVRAVDPDLICVMACGLSLAQNAEHAAALTAHPEAGQLRAVQSGEVWALDANRWFSRPAPGLVRGAELLAQIFRGGADVPGQAIKVSPARDPGR